MAAPFFEQPDTIEAIERLASVDYLTALVGAGASVEAGLPNWFELVTLLLHDVAKRVKAPPDSPTAQDGVSAFCEDLIGAHGLAGAGTIAKTWLADSFENALTRALYGSRPWEPRPGRTSLAIAYLKRVFEEDLEIATTNYDKLLEAALRREQVPGKVKSFVTQRQPSSGVVVRHLHGVLTPTERKGRVVLSESDYHLMQTPSIWQEQYFRDRLTKSTCLFIGTSLSDPNLLRYLYRSPSRREHVAVFVRQGDPWTTRSDLRKGVHEARDLANLGRWRAMRVQPLQADYYFQSAQFVYEVARRAEQGGEYISYVDRLHAWEQGMASGIMQTRSRTLFQDTQEELHETLRELVDVMRYYLTTQRLRAERELIGLHLWARRPRERGLVLLGSSDRTWKEPRAMQSIPIRRPTIWVAVEAFCHGRPLVETAERELASRWRYVVGIPLYLDDEPWGRLPVGVLTLASDRPASRSALARLGPRLPDILAPFLAETAQEVLRP
jgi:hypothetical protein